MLHPGKLQASWAQNLPSSTEDDTNSFGSR